MKKYIQPASEMMKLQIESVIAASLQMHDKGTDAAPLSNHRNIWDSESWTEESY